MILSSLPAGTKTSYTCLAIRSVRGDVNFVYVAGDDQDKREHLIDEWILGQNTLRGYNLCKKNTVNGDMLSQPVAIGKSIGPESFTWISIHDKPCVITIRADAE